jgi:hypothetical protein
MYFINYLLKVSGDHVVAKISFTTFSNITAAYFNKLLKELLFDVLFNLGNMMT